MPPSPRRSTRSLRERLGPSGGRLPLIAAVTAAVLVLDQATKLLATELLAGEGRVEVLGGLVNLELFRNYAGPNNILPGHTVALSIFALVAVVALAAISYRVVGLLSAVAVGLLLGGAIGNLIDRLLREPAPLEGGVIDWLQFGDLTKLMNIADLAIHAAIVVILAGVIAGGLSDRGSDQEPGGDARALRE